MSTDKKIFEFRECVHIVKATGRRAEDLRELRDVIASITGESIFHHTYHYFIRGHILEYTNDFAQWAGENLEERALAEHLSGIDPYVYRDIEDVRAELLRVIDDYLSKFPEPRKAMAGDEFYFNQAVTLTFPAGIRAQNLAEFLIGLRYVDSGSIYYHFYEARMRHGGFVDDFSSWSAVIMGKTELAERIRSIDPFMHDVDGIRTHIIAAVEDEVEKDMEVLLS